MTTNISFVSFRVKRTILQARKKIIWYLPVRKITGSFLSLTSIESRNRIVTAPSAVGLVLENQSIILRMPFSQVQSTFRWRKISIEIVENSAFPWKSSLYLRCEWIERQWKAAICRSYNVLIVHISTTCSPLLSKYSQNETFPGSIPNSIVMTPTMCSKASTTSMKHWNRREFNKWQHLSTISYH